MNPKEMAEVIFRAIHERDTKTLYPLFHPFDKAKYAGAGEPDSNKMAKYFDRELKFLGDAKEIDGEVRKNDFGDIFVKIRPVKKRMHCIVLEKSMSKLVFRGIQQPSIKKYESFEILT